MSTQEHLNVRAILSRAAQLGIEISLAGDDLKLDAAPSVITPQAFSVIRAHKQEIIEHLRQTPQSTPPAPAPRVDSRKIAREIDEAYQILLQRGRLNQAGQRVIDWTVPGSDFPRDYDITLDEYRTRLCVCLFNGDYDRFYAGLDELARIQAQPLQQESGLTPGQAYDQTLAMLKGRLGLTVGVLSA